MIFIAGMHRSGTSLVHFLLGGHPRCVAMGEVWGLVGHPGGLATATESRCSCGSSIAECAFYGPLLPHLDGSGDYGPFLARFEALYPGRICVDSSKSLDAIRRARPHKVLYVIRDVRGWSVSAGRVGVAAYLAWKRENERRMAYLDRENLDWLLVSYDELGLRPEQSLRRICDFLDLEYTDAMLRYREAEHHGIKTSMKLSQRKMAGVAYDYRWMSDAEAQRPAPWLPWVMKFNRDHVYGTLPTAP